MSTVMTLPEIDAPKSEAFAGLLLIALNNGTEPDGLESRAVPVASKRCRVEGGHMAIAPGVRTLCEKPL
ncbi:MAG: hypothetical protein A2Z31_05225 [candidate division NC10 bacterium RBG_16_65_8]|nr:MAG: hypothetical protein A2Z31_05225 [candidate division NC10 bacterium RBG_16_65_8]